MRVNIEGGRLFPAHFLVLAALMLCVGAVLAVQFSYWSVPVMLAGAGMLTAAEGTEIDPGKRTIREYRSFFFLRTGETLKYDALERLYINAGRVSQRLNSAHTSGGRTFSHTEYKVFLRFTQGDPVFLFSGTRHPAVLRRTQALAAKLGIPVSDHAQ